MTRPGTWRRRGAGVALATVLALTAGCGGRTSSDSSADAAEAGKVRFDQALHDLLPDAVKKRGTLTVGTDASYAPMSSFGPDGRTIIGVEPDLGAAIGKVLGVRVRFSNQDFMELLPDVVDGRIDLAMSAMTDTAQRARTVDFVNYFSAGTAIVVQRGNPDAIADIKDLCGRPVAVEAGTTQVDLLARAQTNCPDEPIMVRTYPTNSDALVQLRTGRASAVLNDLPPAVFLVNDERTRSQYQLASTTQYEPGLYGIVVAPDQRGLRDAVQGACEKLLESGAYADVLARWKVSGGAVDRVSIDSDR
jgi:polar amino acid transport system substrate-binding protein